jgi:hypothetical protein
LYTLAFALQLRKKHGKPSVEKCPDIPVAAVQHTFTHKQYTEYRGRNTHNNYKGTKNYFEKNNIYNESIGK